MNVVVVTPTGDRPASLARQARYLQRSVLPAGTNPSWIVIDDGVVPYAPPRIDGWRTVYSRPKPMQGISLLRNLVVGLAEAVLCGPDYVLIWEDDDWYSPSRIENQVGALIRGKADKVYLHGPASSIYYHVPQRMWRLMPNPRHASLFETAFSKELIFPMMEYFKDVEGDRISVDRSIWSHFSSSGKIDPVTVCRDSVGIKGMPGRKGIGCGHRPPTSPKNDWVSDPDRMFLTKLVGDADAAEILAEGEVR